MPSCSKVTDPPPNGLSTSCWRLILPTPKLATTSALLLRQQVRCP